MPSTARAAMTAEAEPEMTPQISPMTSLQNELTRFAFRSSRNASGASATLRDAIAWNGASGQAVTATPMMSNRMPRPMNTASTSAAAAAPAPLRLVSDARLNAADRTMARKKTCTAHR